jgi:hypothetical protein
MFHKQPDHTCLTRYNQRNQEQQRLEAEEAEEEEKKNSATVLIQHLVDFNRLSSLVHKKTKAMEGEFLGSTFSLNLLWVWANTHAHCTSLQKLP